MNLMKHRKWYYVFAMVFVIPSIAGLLLWGLKPSIDFTGGSKLELRGTTDQDKAQEFAESNELSGIVIQEVGDNGLSIRFAEINEEKHRKVSGSIGDFFGDGVEEVAFETVGPTISSEITQNAFVSIALASLIIIFYIGYSFRRVPKPASSFRFGITAIIALAHDTIIVVGVFAFLGRFLNIEVDPLFITGLLTVIGFSVHDTIVIFDRIRENLIKKGASELEGTVNLSLLEMLPRTINTSFLVWSILLILFLLGGETTKYFVLTLVIGILAGTYSSLFVASPLLITWQELKKKKKLSA
ncbi:MAG: protein translocase subunit SecF [Patescibacteria group bacterium]|nr:protein translocase subunit SecF [Patescibacteria group bacterium]